MKRLSIIVPIYNLELYVEKCLRSLEDQDISKDDYEIICINDGSSDDSHGVVMRMQKEFDNIVLINQENKGVSAARNNGIDSVKGNYIMMVDADDYIKSNVMKERLDIMEKYDLDIGFTGYIILNDTFKEEYCYDPLYDPKNLLNGIDYEYKYERGKSEIRDPHRSVAIFLKGSFLNSNSLRYLEGVPYLEDGEFMARVICLANRVAFLNGPFYMRTIISGSATQSRLYYSEKARNGFLKAAYNLLQFKQNYCKNDKQKVFMNQPIIQFTILYLISLEGIKYLRYYSQLVSTLKNGPLNTLETEGCSDFFGRMGNYYNVSIHCFFFHWTFFRFRMSLKMKVSKIFDF